MTPDQIPFARRSVLAMGAALCLAGAGRAAPSLAAPVAPPGHRLPFHVYRKGRKIGEHVLDFTTDGDAITMRARVQMVVGLGPVTLFRYRHQQTERWVGGRFDSLQTDTTQNGAKFRIDAQRTPAGVRLEGAKGGPRTLGATALPLTHWNRASLAGPLFNPQDGKMMRLAVIGQGPAPFALADGKSITTTRVVLGGETSIEEFYDAGGIWIGLRAKAQDGSIVEYRRA